MPQYKLLFAILLLTSPSDTDQISQPQRLFCALSGSLQEVAIAWEIMDSRERSHVLARDQDLKFDLHMLQNRIEELQFAPYVQESQRFPDKEIVNGMISFNRMYHQDMLTRLSFDQLHSEHVRHAVQENQKLFQIWDTVRDIKCPYFYITVRRRALNRLRQQIGDRAFYSGELPPPVPMERLPWYR